MVGPDHLVELLTATSPGRCLPSRFNRASTAHDRLVSNRGGRRAGVAEDLDAEDLGIAELSIEILDDADERR